MSRSYKKFMVVKDPCDKWYKRKANRAVRLYEEMIPKGSAYKKLYCSWNICDYRVYASWYAFCSKYCVDQLIKGSTTYKEVYRQWYTQFKSK